MASQGSSGRTSPDEFVERLREVSAANASGRKQLLRRFGAFVQEAAQAVGTGQSGQRTDAGALLARWLDFNLESYSLVNVQGLALLNGLLSAAERALIPTTASAPDTPGMPAPRIELRLSGRHGERATTRFAIENHFDRPLAVAFQSTDLISKTGTSLPASLVSFEPATLVVEQRGEGVVQATVAITTDFEVGQTYTATIRLVGYEAKEVGLSVTVLPPTDVTSDRSPQPRKSAKERRARDNK